METFSALLAICAGNLPVTGEFPAQRPVMRSFDVFFHLHLNKQLSKQSWGWWFETSSHPLWCHCNETEETNKTSLCNHVCNINKLSKLHFLSSKARKSFCCVSIQSYSNYKLFQFTVLSHTWFHIVNSLRPSDAIWRQRSGSTLAQVMACWLTAPSHHLNQCWVIISAVHQ